MYVHVRCSAQLQVPSYQRSQRLVALLAMVAWGDRCRSSWEDAARGTASAGVRTASWFGNGHRLCGCHCWNSPWLCRTGPLASGSRQGCVGALRWHRGGVAPEVLQGLGGGNLARPQLLPHLGFWVGLLVWSGLRSSSATYTYSTFYLQINAWCFYPPSPKEGMSQGMSQLLCSNCNTEIPACKKWYQATAPGLKHSRLCKAIVSL